LNIRQRVSPSTSLPVAALPDYGDGMGRLVMRAKVRPAVVYGHPHQGPIAGAQQAKWQTHQTLTVIPAYGDTQNAARAGWPEDLRRAVRHAKWPQYMWDVLPIGGDTNGSVLMLNRAFPIGSHHNYYEALPWVLSDIALSVLDEWMTWLWTGKMREDGDLYTARSVLLEMDDDVA
jgi:hypothetical protein